MDALWCSPTSWGLVSGEVCLPEAVLLLWNRALGLPGRVVVLRRHAGLVSVPSQHSRTSCCTLDGSMCHSFISSC